MESYSFTISTFGGYGGSATAELPATATSSSQIINTGRISNFETASGMERKAGSASVAEAPTVGAQALHPIMMPA